MTARVKKMTKNIEIDKLLADEFSKAFECASNILLLSAKSVDFAEGVCQLYNLIKIIMVSMIMLVPKNERDEFIRRTLLCLCKELPKNIKDFEKMGEGYINSKDEI
jgi:hypothetical protein